jgi:hypothetical protein
VYFQQLRVSVSFILIYIKGLFTMESSKEIVIILKSPLDWRKWNTHFEGVAVSNNLRAKISKEELFLQKPIPPQISQFFQAPQPPIVSVPASDRVTRSQAAAEESQGTLSGDPVIPTPSSISLTTVVDDPLSYSMIATSFGALSTSNQKAFQFAYNLYNAAESKYDKEIEAIEKLKTHIRKTVSPDYQITCCNPKESITQWYEKLTQSVAISDENERKQLKDSYKEAVKPLKNSKDIEKWITNWEQVISLAFEKKLPMVASPADWFDDFLDAVRPFATTWVDSYEIAKKAKVLHNEHTYREVANDFRDVARRRLMYTRPNKVAAGSFQAALDSGDCNDRLPSGTPAGNDQGISETIVPRTRGKRSGGKTDESQKEKKQMLSGDVPSEGHKACQACGQFHHYHFCYYLFPEIRPEWFVEREFIRKIVDKFLKENPDFAK